MLCRTCSGGRTGVMERAGGLVLVLAVMGCGHLRQRVRGVAPAEAPVAMAAKSAAMPSGARILLRGEMTEKCPVAGCWFKLKDASGVVRVDTRTAGFVVSDIPLHTQMTVAGSVSHEEPSGVAATGIRY